MFTPSSGSITVRSSPRTRLGVSGSVSSPRTPGPAGDEAMSSIDLTNLEFFTVVL